MRAFALALALLTTAVIAAEPVKQPFTPPPVVVHQRTPVRVQVDRGTENDPFFISGKVHEEKTKEEQKADADKAVDDYELTKATDYLAWGTFFLGFMSVVSALLAWREIKLQKEDTAKLERAYVFVTVGALFPTPRDGIVDLQATATISNFGKTPAVLRKWRAFLIDLPQAPDVLPDFPRSNRELPEGLVIAANGNEPLDFKSTGFPLADYNNLRGANSNLYAIGEITYNDVMDVEHKTGFCWQCQFRADGNEHWTIVPSRVNKTT